MYRAKTSNGPRLPVYQRRVSPTEATEYIQREDVVVVEADNERDGLGHIRLYESPAANFGGSGMTVANYVTGELFTGSKTWPPSDGEFYVSPYKGVVYFNQSAVGTEVRIDYVGTGSLVDAVDINYIHDKADAASKVYTGKVVIAGGASTIINGYAVQNYYATYTSNPNESVAGDSTISVAVNFIEDPDNLASTITNNGSSEVTVYWKGLPAFEPEK